VTGKIRNTPGILVETPDGKPTDCVLIVGGWIILKFIIEPARQCTYNATMRRVHETIVAVGKQ
jgi:hypothetical protein